MFKKASKFKLNMTLMFLLASLFLFLFIALDKNPGLFTKEVEVNVESSNPVLGAGNRVGLIVTNSSVETVRVQIVKKNVSLLTYWLSRYNQK